MKNTEKKLKNRPIEFDPFTLRQFEPTFKGTNLSKVNIDELINLINSKWDEYWKYVEGQKYLEKVKPTVHLLPSQWDFCKYLVIENPYSEIRSAVLSITLQLYPFIRTGYSARTPQELPVLSRWCELPPGFEMPRANYIVCVLYSRDQLFNEFVSKNENVEFYFDENVLYGIVAILGTTTPEPEPLVPITTMRNCLGIEEGGNGTLMNRAEYMKSIEFWNNHIMVK